MLRQLKAMIVMAGMILALNQAGTATAMGDGQVPAPPPAPPGVVLDNEGYWVIAQEATEEPELVAQAIAETGGPDDYGYTWNSDVPLNWIDVSGGIDPGLSLDNNHSGPINIGFPFKYYENTYTELFISLYGFISFPGTTQWWHAQSDIPNAGDPNNVIAPHWGPIDRIDGYIRYVSIGTAPDRRFVVEWNRVGEGANEYTFQVVLEESGTILFQYLDVVFHGGPCTSSGIEDSTGLDGLMIVDLCQSSPSNSAVSITRPSASSRVRIDHQYQGAIHKRWQARTLHDTCAQYGGVRRRHIRYCDEFFLACEALRCQRRYPTHRYGWGYATGYRQHS